MIKNNNCLVILSALLSTAFLASCGGGKGSNTNSNQQTKQTSDKGSQQNIDLFLAKIYKVEDKNSVAIADSYLVDTTIKCGNEADKNQVINSDENKPIDLTTGQECIVTVNKLTLVEKAKGDSSIENRFEYAPKAHEATQSNNTDQEDKGVKETKNEAELTKLILKVDANRNVEATEKAVEYFSERDEKPIFINGATSHSGSLVLGITHSKDKFSKENFTFDSYELAYKGEAAAVEVSSLEKYKGEYGKSVFGFTVPDSTDENLHKITWGGATVASKFTVKLKSKEGIEQDVTLQGFSMPSRKCGFVGWALNVAGGHADCGMASGFKIIFNPEDNTELQAGEYTGNLIMNALNWNKVDSFKNIIVKLNVNVSSKKDDTNVNNDKKPEESIKHPAIN